LLTCSFFLRRTWNPAAPWKIELEGRGNAWSRRWGRREKGGRGGGGGESRSPHPSNQSRFTRKSSLPFLITGLAGKKKKKRGGRKGKRPGANLIPLGISWRVLPARGAPGERKEKKGKGDTSLSYSLNFPFVTPNDTVPLTCAKEKGKKIKKEARTIDLTFGSMKWPWRREGDRRGGHAAGCQ